MTYDQWKTRTPDDDAPVCDLCGGYVQHSRCLTCEDAEHEENEQMRAYESEPDLAAAFEADGEMLRQLTGEDHGPYFLPPADPRDPDPSRPGVFAYHNCYRCHSGALPCVKGNPRDCDTLHARND